MDIRIYTIILLTLCVLRVLGHDELEEKNMQALFNHFMHEYQSANVQPHPSTDSKHIQHIYKKTKKQTFVPHYPEQFNAPFPIHPFFLKPHYQENIYTEYVPLSATHSIPVPELVYPLEESHHRVLIPFSYPYPFLYGHSTTSGGLNPNDYFTSIDSKLIPVTNPNIHYPYNINDDRIELLHTINTNSGENGGEHAENNVHLQIIKPMKKPSHIVTEPNEDLNNLDKPKPVKDVKVIENTPSPDKIEIPLTPTNDNPVEIGGQVEENHVHSQVVAPSSEKPLPEETAVNNEDNKPNTTQDSKLIDNITQDLSSNEEHAQQSNIFEVNIPTPSPVNYKNTLEPNLFQSQTTLNTEEIDKLDVRFPIINIPSTENLVHDSKATEMPSNLKQNTMQASNVEENPLETNTNSNITETSDKITRVEEIQKSVYKPATTTELSYIDKSYDNSVFLSTISSLPKIQETTTLISTFSSLPSVTTKTTDQQDNLGNNSERANNEDDSNSSTSAASLTSTTLSASFTSTTSSDSLTSATSSDSLTSATSSTLISSTTLSDPSTLTTSLTSSTPSSINPSYQSPQTEYNRPETESSGISTFITTLPSSMHTRDSSVSEESSKAYPASSTTTEETISVTTLSSNQYYSTESFKSAEISQGSNIEKEIISTSPSKKSTDKSNLSSYKDAVQPLDDPDDSDDQLEEKLSNPNMTPECQSSRNSKNNDNSCYNENMNSRSSTHVRLPPPKKPILIIPTKIKPPKHFLPKLHPKLHIGRDSEDTENRDGNITESPENDEINTAKLYTTELKQKIPNNHATPEQIEMLLKRLTKYFKPEYGNQILTKQNSLLTMSKPEDKDLIIILPWIFSESAKNLEQNKQLEMNNYKGTD